MQGSRSGNEQKAMTYIIIAGLTGLTLGLTPGFFLAGCPKILRNVTAYLLVSST